MDTICACATPPLNGGISIVRISGEDAKSVALDVFSKKQLPPRTMVLGEVLGDTGVVDKCLCVFFASPNSFTGEDVVEFHCHGGYCVTNTLINLLIKKGVRIALPGEFTKRAFINGKTDLAEAQAVGELIGALSEKSATASVKRLRGELSRKIDSAQDTLTDILAELEVHIEYPEEDIEHTLTLNKLADILRELTRLERTFNTGRLLSEGAQIAIVGRPNVGKSSLLNAFLGTPRAIVTDVAGTTRDTITETYSLDGLPLILTDTAGIRNSDDAVERIGVDISKSEIEKCDVVLFVLDSSCEISGDDREIFALLKTKPHITVLNKSDLEGVVTEKDVKSAFGITPVCISAKHATGLDELKSAIFTACAYDETATEGVMINNARQHEAVLNAINCLNDAINAIKSGLESELIATDLKDAWHCLGFITGKTLTQDIVDRIFSSFCLGK